MTSTSFLVSLVAGAVLLPYATLWLSRSGRVRERAVRFARTGWHRWLAVGGAVLALYTLAAGGGRLLPAPPIPLAWAAVTLSLVTAAHVEVLVAAEAMRAYPDDRALHYDLSRPCTWVATSARIVSAWGWLMRERHPWLAPGFLASSLSLALGPQFGVVPVSVWSALAASTLVLGLCCLPFPRLVGLPGGFLDGDLPP
ncbi:hypothetical protein [Halomarina litorea]|uniref:hypothetical protein n=1 Tax=Halomarina litorea TaxID=2961595 RepID=UPI0020C4BCFD|nr:hypothetical protein [Halomarina sp. BCD28]